MTKKEIAKKIAEEHGLTYTMTQKIVQRTFDQIVAALAQQGRIELRKFGVFEVRTRAAHNARNPRTGEQVQVPARNAVTFKPGKEMEEIVRSIDPSKAPVGPGQHDGESAETEERIP